jgi:hypothetical protein
MPFIISVEHNPLYTRFQVAGPASLKNYFDLIEEAERQSTERGIVSILVDLRQVAGRLIFTDQFFIGDVVSQKLSRVAKMAVVVPGDPTSYNSETVAKRRGAQLRNFSSEDSALAWLLDSGG